ncbi:MAG: cysteine--tRNA ligase [Actinobacteria bacterium]|uniref:Cysteine--tRNA ligase n=1 Tax=freshwater metagenome TaxID=449393 RepID=A0A6J6ANG7_9ZZZZ|nr:cysteine--tRNA ligase [Actinomycetota bacterium]MTB21856.1 cysteine--tRNA ligase [Actinomycetota bacterium]
MVLSIYDTFSRKPNPITSHNGVVTMYCCGPTVYRDAHVGNLRTFLLSDLIARTISLSGLSVEMIQNITDVGHMSDDFQEDKMLEQSKKEKIDPFDIARKYEERFHVDLANLNIVPAQKYPRASESIDLMLEMISALILKGAAYVGEDGTVYFDAQSFPGYGQISGNRLESLKPGHRYEYVEDGVKKFHADWSLWKPAGDRKSMVWDSPWGPGFPGWHIECSAMSLKFLHGHVNIHVGGIDLRFPHHENERAQSNSITGTESVDLWVHGEHLLFEGRKMSKSAGNVVLLDDVIAKGFDPLALRLCFLENRYRSQMDLSWQSISAAHDTIKRWRNKISAWGTSETINIDASILAFLENDLDTPRVITYLRSIEKDNTLSDSEKVNAFLFADQVLGLELSRTQEVQELTSELKDLLEQRESARSAKNWALSDDLRVRLENAGLEISDSASGQSWSWR